MKVFFQVPLAEVDSAYITMENTNFTVRSIAPICRTIPVYAVDTADNTKINIYLQIDKTVQGAGSTGGAAGIFEIIDNNKFNGLNNWQNVTVAKFVKGATYLIPAGSRAPLDMIPNILEMPIGNRAAIITTATVGVSVTATHFLYRCPEDRDIMNATSIANCIQVEVNGAATDELTKQKSKSNAAQMVNYALAVGVPAASLGIQPSGEMTGGRTRN